MRALAMLFLVAGSGPIATASAQPTEARVVVVRSGPEDAEIAERAQDALAAALTARGEPARVPSEPPEAEPVRPLLERAADAYANLRPGDAASQLRALLERLDVTGATGADRADLLRALVLTALAAAATGDQDTLGTALDRVLAIDPTFELDPAEYPPTLRDRLEARRTDRPTHALSLSGVPGDARVWIDGAPAEGARFDLPEGSHLVRIAAPGSRPWARRLEIAGDQAVQVALEPDPERVLADPGSVGGGAAALEAAARALSVRLVLLDVRRDADGWVLHVDDASSGRSASTRLTTAEEIRPKTAEIARALLAPRSTPLPPPEDDESVPAWPFVAAGGVAVALAVTVVVLLVTGAEQGGGRWSRP